MGVIESTVEGHRDEAEDHKLLLTNLRVIFSPPPMIPMDFMSFSYGYFSQRSLLLVSSEPCVELQILKFCSANVEYKAVHIRLHKSAVHPIEYIS